MSVRASSPGKILLFGEWAVLEGAPGIAMAVGPRLMTKWTPSSHPGGDSVLIVRGDGMMALWDPRKALQDQGSVVPPFLLKPVGMLSSLMMRSPEARNEILKGGDLRVERLWPLEYGLGSSSAIVACLLEIFCGPIERLTKWQLGREILRDVQGGRASALDLAAQLRGAFVVVVDHKPRPVMNLTLPKEICFVHAGHKADTSHSISQNPVSDLQKQHLGNSAREFLNSKDWLKALREHARVMSTTPLWPEPLREARKTWMDEALIVDMKSCGAGGGDTWMIWCEEPKQRALKEACESRKWVFKKYEVEHQGVTIVEA